MAEVVTRESSQVGVQSYVEWGAVIAGTVAALAVSIVLLAFGAAIGLASVSPWTTTATGIKAVGVGSAFWFLLVTLWSFALGGYLAGRLRHRWIGATATEVRFRDSTHGLLVWALTVLIAAILAASGVSALGRGVAAAAGSATGASDQVTATTDLMFRSTNTSSLPQTADARGEVSRLLLRSAAKGELSDADRTYLAQLIAARTGISQTDAEKRVTDSLDQLKAATDRARKIGVVLAFLAASILLIGGAIAWWAAGVGGRHRETGEIWHGFAEVKRY